MTYSNKDWYEGNFEKGERHGFGRFFTQKSGVVYEGPWERGKQHGIGVIFGLEGKRRRVKYEEGRVVKWISDEDFEGGRKIGDFDGVSSSLM